MKKFSIKNLGLAGLFCALSLPIYGYAASVESDVADYLKDKNPQSISEYPAAFTDVFDKHAPIIQESTLSTTVYYFNEADNHSKEDLGELAKYAVIAAIAKARSDGNEDDLAAFITDAVCGSFKGGLHAAYKQVTSADATVRAAYQAALDEGVEPAYASTAVTRGVDTCLEQRLDNDVAMVIGGIVGNYLAPYQAYLPPTLGSGDVNLLRKNTQNFPGFDTDTCVSNCL